MNWLVAWIEKIVMTWVQAFVALLVVADRLDITVLTAGAIAAVPAAMTAAINGMPGVPAGLPLWVDVTFRVARTYVASFLGFLIALPVFALDADVAYAAALAAVPPALAALKAGIATRVGREDSAALLPAALDPAA